MKKDTQLSRNRQNGKKDELVKAKMCFFRILSNPWWRKEEQK